MASLGTIGSFALGWGVAAWLVPEAGTYAHVFLGATVTATSVGITARVFKDLGRARSPEARTILGAAVIDDVQGLVILAVLTGVIGASGQGGFSAIGLILAKAGLFLLGALTLGIHLSPRLFSLASKLEAGGVLLAFGLSFCFLLAWLADAIGLASIVGAFAAGLILETCASCSASVWPSTSSSTSARMGACPEPGEGSASSIPLPSRAR